jgi:cytoskeletal protein RodZ
MDTRKCENCGEYYSVTYKRCPFCDEKSERNAAPARRKSGGGKRLASNTKGGGYGRPRSQFMRIFALLLSLVLIVAAICIVISIVRTLLHTGGSEGAAESPATTEQTDTSGNTDPTEPPETTEPIDSQPSGADTSIPEVTLATSMELNSTDITLFSVGEKAQLTAKLLPEGTSGEVSWSTSNQAVATVSSTGLVTAVAKGTANVTATMGDVSKTCIVRCNFRTSDTTTGTAAAPTAALTLNRSDFTLSHAGENFTLVASGASGTVTWSIGNSSVATIDQNGTGTAGSNGYTTVTATASGAKATCVVRVAIS